MSGNRRATVAIWTVVFLVMLWASYVGSRQTQELALEFPPRWKTLAFALTMTTVIWGTVFVAAVMSRVYRIRRDNLARTLPIHFLVNLLLVGLFSLPMPLLQWLGVRSPFPKVELSANDLIPYFLFVACIHGFRLARESHHNNRRALELGVELSE